MIKKILILIIIITGVTENMTAQDAVIENLTTPGSPAFTILGISPTSIEKPEVPEKLAVNLINNLSDKLLPSDFSLEVSPAYIYNNFLTFDEYNLSYQGFWKNMSFSLATSKPFDTNATSLGLGARTLIFNGSPTLEVLHLMNRVKISTNISYMVFYILKPIIPMENITIVSLKNKIDIRLNEMRPEVFDYASFNNLTKEQYEKALEITEEFFKEYFESSVVTSLKFDETVKELIKEKSRVFSEKYFKEDYEEIRKEGDKRLGFRLEAAFALSAEFENDSINSGQFKNFALWLNPSLEEEKFKILCLEIPNIKLLNLTRVISDRNFRNFDIDIGIGIHWQLHRLGVSVTGIDRMASRNYPTYSYTFNIEYKLAKSVFLTGSFGKDFEGDVLKSQKGDLITLLGVNFGFGTTQEIGSKTDDDDD